RVVKVANTTQGSRSICPSGRLLDEMPVKIADPETCVECPAGHVGEIWCGGKSIGMGYWKRPKETEETFRAKLATGDGTWLRSGDLGFVLDGRLFVTGRLKDLIIIAGANHYPQDIEWTVETSHPHIRPNSSAAFSVMVDGAERLVVVAEVKTKAGEFARI